MGACDYCIRERARWYCAADDAFLCQTCDSWVHSASLLAGRHRRVHLNPQEDLAPSWNHPRKPRSTPRYPAKHKEEPPLVPEICADGDDDDDHNDQQQQLLYRVPTLQQDDEESFALDMRFLWEGVKVEEDDHELPMLANHHHQNQSFDTATGLKFDYGEKVKTEESSAAANEEESGSTIIVPHKKKTTVLNLDYEGVMSAWSDERSPWTTGQRPEMNSDEIWPDSMAMGMTTIGQGGGREARVLRYREKRRRRMFCKKIRYEVRKLNAEKRPRMKGRFVKRTTNFPAPLALLNNQ